MKDYLEYLSHDLQFFKTAPPFPSNTQAKIVLAYVGLHNFIPKECYSVEFPLENDSEISMSSHALTNQEDFEPSVDT